MAFGLIVGDIPAVELGAIGGGEMSVLNENVRLAPFAFGVFGGLENAAAFEFDGWGIGAEDGAAGKGGENKQAR